MESSSKTARQLYSEVKANPTRKRFGFGKMPALINIDLQKAYTCVGEFATAYETDPRQLEHVNELASEFRSKGFPVVWTYVAHMESGEDCGVWGTRLSFVSVASAIGKSLPTVWTWITCTMLAWPRPTRKS